MADLFKTLALPVTTPTATLVAGTVDFYEPGLTGDSNRKDVYTDSAGTIVAANPYTLNATATATLYGTGLYHIVIKNSLGTTIYDYDFITPDQILFVFNPATLAALRAAPGYAGAVVNLISRTAVGDGGEGTFDWDSSDLSVAAAVDTDLIKIVPPTGEDGSSGAWVRRTPNDDFDFRWSSAAIDGVTDDYTAVNGFFKVVNYYNGAGYFPAGTIYFGTLVTLALSNCSFHGIGDATILTGDFGYGLLKLLDVDTVTFKGIFFRNDYSNAVLDQGTGTVYSYQNDVKDLEFIECKFSNTDSNNPALAIYARITVADVDATIDGFRVRNCRFINVGGIACSVMNRGEVAGVGQYTACIGVDFSGNYGYNCGTQSSFGFLLTLDGYGVGTTVRDNRCGKMLGIGIENTGHINAIFENNTFFDHSTSYAPMSFSGAPFSGSSTRHTMTGNRIANNVVEGASLAASNFIDVSDSTFDSNYFEATGTPAATLRGSNNRLFGEVYVSDHNFAVQVGDATLTTKGNIFDTCTCDNSASVANFYALLFLGTLTTDNQFVNARLLKGSGGGFTVAQTTSASNNVVWNYTTATVSSDSAEKIIALPDTNYTLSDNDEAIIAYDAIEFTGTLSAGRTVDFPVALFVKPKQIKNSSGQILTFSVDGTSGGTLANGATGVLIYKPSTGAPDVW